MKPQLILIASLAILTLAVVAQETQPSKVYEPFTPQEVSEMTHDTRNQGI